MQQVLKWRYYNHAIVPTTAPHETVDESPLNNESLWQSMEGFPLFARWTTDFDCQEETGWWYIIKDKPFDFMDVTRNYRKKIRRGLKNFDIRIIDPTKYAEELYQVQVEAFSSYPAKYRPKLDHDQFIANLSNQRRKGVITAAFSKEDNSLAGYCYDIPCNGYVWASVQKAKPSQEKKQVNAALIYGELDYFSRDLADGAYIVAGERNILHETNCQQYFEKTFGFRKAYCRLHIQYRPSIRRIMACLYPIRGLIKRLGNIKPFCQISSVLKMEEIARQNENPRPIKEGRGNADSDPQPLHCCDKALSPRVAGRIGQISDARRA